MTPCGSTLNSCGLEQAILYPFQRHPLPRSGGRCGQRSGEWLFTGVDNGEPRGALVQFDVAGRCRAMPVIKDVNLYLRHDPHTPADPLTVGLIQPVESGEKALRRRAMKRRARRAAEPGDATRLHSSYDTVFWNRARRRYRGRNKCDRHGRHHRQPVCLAVQHARQRPDGGGWCSNGSIGPTSNSAGRSSSDAKVGVKRTAPGNTRRKAIGRNSSLPTALSSRTTAPAKNVCTVLARPAGSPAAGITVPLNWRNPS